MSDNNLILSRAKAAVLSRDYTLAARLYTELLRKRPDDMHILEDLGSLYIKSGNDRKALPIYRQINMLEPENFDALLSLGGIYRRLKKYEQSVEVLGRALETGKNDVQANYSLGFTYKFMGKYDDAIDCFESVITENPSDVLAFNHLGVIYTARKEYDKAVSAFTRGLKADQNHPILHLNLAHTYEAMKKYSNAALSYSAALRARPGWMEAVADFSNLLIKLKQTDKAEQLVDQALVIEPKNLKMHTIRGNVYNINSDYENAAKEFEFVIESEPKNISALSGLAEAYENSGNIAKSLEVMSMYHNIDPEDPDMLKQYSGVYLSAENTNEAGKKISRLLKKYPQDTAALDLAVQYYIMKKNPDKALIYQQKIKHLDPSYSDFYLAAAKRYRQLNNLREARHHAELFLHLSPNNAKGLVFLAQIEDSEGNSDKAIELCNKALKYDKNNRAAKNLISRVKKAEEENRKIIQAEGKLEALDEGFKLPSDEEISMDIDETQFENEENQEEPAPEPEENDSVLFDPESWGDNALTEDAGDDDLLFADDDENELESPIDEETLDDLVEEDDTPIDTSEEDEEQEENDDSLVFSPEPGLPPSRINPFDTGLPAEAAVPENPDSDTEDTAPDIPEPVPDTGIEHPGKDESADAMEDSSPENQIEENSTDKGDASLPESPVEDEVPQTYPPGPSSPVNPPENETSRRYPQPPAASPTVPPEYSPSPNPPENREYRPDDYPEPCRPQFPSEKENRGNEQFERKLNDINDVLNKTISASKDAVNAADEIKRQLDRHSAEAADRASNLVKQLAEMSEKSAQKPLQENKEISTSEVQENVKNLLDKTADFLPAIANALQNRDTAEKYNSELDLFKKLRAMSEYLPDEQKKQFLQSKMRLLLDYLISRLSGKPGLLATAEALRNSGTLKDFVPEGNFPENSEGPELVKKVLHNMETMAKDLEDKNLAVILNKTADEALEQMRLIAGKKKI